MITATMFRAILLPAGVGVGKRRDLQCPRSRPMTMGFIQRFRGRPEPRSYRFLHISIASAEQKKDSPTTSLFSLYGYALLFAQNLHVFFFTLCLGAFRV
jgi:hypothetical protein